MAKIKIQSKKEAVYNYLREVILNGEIAPGSHLVIDELANDLGVSTIPIREALHQLEAEGFVAIKPYAGAQVTELHPRLIAEVFAVLEATEVISGRLACHQICEDNLTDIEKLLREMDMLIDDPDRWSGANIRFHRTICDCSGATLIKDIMDRMLSHWDRLRRYYLKGVFGNRIHLAQRDHWEMFHALRNGDPDLVEEVVRKHNRNALSAYIDYLKPGDLEGIGSYFDLLGKKEIK